MIYSARHFALFRILFGGFVAIYLLCLLPYASEMFGAQSFFVTAERSFTMFRQVFPSVLDDPRVGGHPSLFVAVLLLAAVAFSLGTARRSAAIVLWYGLACLINRNPGIMNPSHAFMGWLFLASAIVPPGEPWSLGRRRESWRMPPVLFWGAWWVMALAYSASGMAKVQSPGWLDGTALSMTLDMAYAHDGWLRSLLLSLPTLLLRLSTWSVLAIELLFAPLALLARTRRLAWFAMVALHCALFLLFDFWEISFGMLLWHVFTFDERWLPADRG